MTIAALAACAVLIALLGVLLLEAQHNIRSLIREHARERQLLLDRIMHLADKTWTPPPSEQTYENPAPELSYDYSSSMAMPDLYGTPE